MSKLILKDETKYVRQIEMGRMVLEDVPKRWHDKVKAELEKEQTDEE